MKPEEPPPVTSLPARLRAVVGRNGLNTRVMPTASPPMFKMMPDPDVPCPDAVLPPELEHAAAEAAIRTAAAATAGGRQRLVLPCFLLFSTALIPPESGQWWISFLRAIPACGPGPASGPGLGRTASSATSALRRGRIWAAGRCGSAAWRTGTADGTGSQPA